MVDQCHKFKLTTNNSLIKPDELVNFSTLKIVRPGFTQINFIECMGYTIVVIVPIHGLLRWLLHYACTLLHAHDYTASNDRL